MSINPYEILGIDKNATIEEINKAYFILAKKYHLDINKSSEANQRMQEINIAHEILKNSEERRQYDFIHDEKYKHENQFTSSQKIYNDVFRCQRCGAIDHTLRIVHFPFVISLLIVTLKRGWGGIYCSECRKEEMAKAKIISLFLGWWGFPWGVIYTFESLFLSEGKIPQQPNSEFLKALGNFLFRIGDVYGARESFKLSNDFENDKYIENLLERLDQMNPIERKKDKQSKPTLTFFRIALGLVCVIPIFFLSINDFENTKVISPTPTVDVPEYIQAMESISSLSSWDTYNNYSNGFSIDYPSNFRKEISDNQVSFSTASSEKDSDFIYYQVYFEDLDFSISYTDLTQSIIDNIQTEMFIDLGYKVITPLKKEFIDDYPALTGVYSIIIEDMNAIEFSSMVFKNNRVYTLVVIGPEEIQDLVQINFQIYKESFIIN